MSQHSETMGSFIRTGSYPLEADLVFDSYTSLQEWAEENKDILHEGLFKIVLEDDKQQLFWAVKQGDKLFFEEFSSAACLDESVTATNVTVGNIKNGDVIPEGTTFTQFVLKMLVKPQSPTYSISSISNLAATVEVGTQVNGATGVFVPNQGGAITNVAATISGFLEAVGPTVSRSGNTINIALTGRIKDGSNTVSSTVAYAGSTLFPEIKAGSVTASKTISGARKYFRGNEIAPATNSGIRAGTNSLASSSITYALNAGSTDMWIAIPSSKRITSATDAGALNAVITGNFVKVNTLKIDGATAGKDSVDYNVYQMTGYGPFGSAHNITFNIA